VTWWHPGSPFAGRGLGLRALAEGLEEEAAGDASVYQWDYSKTTKVTTVSPAGGKVQVDVTSAPVVVIAP
jgi:hypothetical protein